MAKNKSTKSNSTFSRGYQEALLAASRMKPAELQKEASRIEENKTIYHNAKVERERKAVERKMQKQQQEAMISTLRAENTMNYANQIAQVKSKSFVSKDSGKKLPNA